MSKKWMLWSAVPVLLLASPWPAWLWWKQYTKPPAPWAERGAGLVPLALPEPGGAGPSKEPRNPGVARSEVVESGSTARALQEEGAEPVQTAGDETGVSFKDMGPGSGVDPDEAFVQELFEAGGLKDRIAKRSPWATGERRRLLEKDWVKALTALRYQHRLATEAGGMEYALIGAPGDLLFTAMLDLGDEIDAGRVHLAVPEKPGLDPEFGSATARFRLEPKQKTLVVEVRTRYGYFDLALGRDCGEPDLREALWGESGLFWRALLK